MQLFIFFFFEAIQPTILYCLKKDVEKENIKQLEELVTPPHTFESEDISMSPDSSFLSQLVKSCPAVKSLTLKEGAQVMLLRNLDVGLGLCNGARGVVVGFEDENGEKKEAGCPIVQFSSGLKRTISSEGNKLSWNCFFFCFEPDLFFF